MILVNFMIVTGAAENGPAWLVCLVGMLEGRAAAVFVVLAGVGISLLSGQGRVSGDRNLLARSRGVLLRRALFLFIAGLLLVPLWPADILHFYGVYIAVAAFLLSVRPARLWGTIGLLLVTSTALVFVFDYELGWDWQTLAYAGFWNPAGFFRNLFFNGFHPVVPWLAFLVLGMILGRQDLEDPAARRRVLRRAVAAALVAELLSRLLVHVLGHGAEPRQAEIIQAVFGTGPMPPLPLYMIAAGGTACAVIALFVALGQRFGGSPQLRPFAAAGRLALTLYIMHVVVGLGGLALVGRLHDQTLPFAVAASVLFYAGAVVFAHRWEMRFRRGPVEWLMRTLTR